MTAPVRPTANPELGKLRSVIANYRQQGATAEEISELIAKYHPEFTSTPATEAAREPMGTEDTIRGAIANAGEGVGFSLADEVMGGLRGAIDPRISMGEGIDQVRQERDRFAEANPKTALGLTLAGGLTSGLGLGIGAAKAVPVASRAASIAASGAGGGALAGYGSGEGGPLAGNRLGRAAGFGALGFGLGAAAPRVLQTATGLAGHGGIVDDAMAAAVPRATTGAGSATRTAASATAPARLTMAPQMGPAGGPTAPLGSSSGYSESALRTASDALSDPTPIGQRIKAWLVGQEPPTYGNARARLSEAETAGMGDEVLAMNLGGDRAARSVRAAANLPNSEAGQLVNERLARQGGALGEAVPGDIGKATGFGSAYPEVIQADMQDALGAKVKAGYDAFRAIPEVPLDPTDEAQRLFIERYVQPVIKNRQMTGNLTNSSALSGENVDAAFKNLQREIRGMQTGVSMGTRGVAEAQTLEAMRDRVLRAIDATDPNYAQLARTYALDEDVGKVVQESFETGRGIKTPGEATVALRGARPSEARAMQAGNVASLQSAARRGASNADLGDMAKFRDVARAVVGTPEARETFIALHGREQYDDLLGRLMPKIRAAAQNAQARGNSTTTKQLLDALAAGDEAAMDLLGGITTGGPRNAAMKFVSGLTLDPMNRAVRLGIGQRATEAADLLTTKGAAKSRTLLDLLEELGIEDVNRRSLPKPLSGAVQGATTRTFAGNRP